ncbi:regulator of nonsense transcripts 3, partial [Tremellales sp. Uapishka_1]
MAAVARTKLVIRRLPPTLPAEIFWKSVSAWVTDETCLWKQYIKGRAGDAYGSHPVHSRAYCLMADNTSLVNFHRGFDGHVFRSKAGVEYQAVVEFAPMQKTPYKVKTKADARQGTIEDDPDFTSFLNSLSAPATKPILEVSAPESQPLTTPLIEHLRLHGKAAKRQAKSSSSTSTEPNRKSAALASITAAASRRGASGPAAPGVVMVAGKGRNVTIAPTTAGEAEEGKGKKKGKGKAEGGLLPLPSAASGMATAPVRSIGEGGRG